MTEPFGADPSAAQEWVDNWSASLTDRAAKAQAMSDQVAQLSVSASSSDGAVEVTVAGSGIVTDLHLGELVRKWPAGQIAAAILTVMRQAQAKLAARVAEVAAQTIGADSDAGRAVVASFAQRFPAVVADDDAGSASDWRGRA